MVAYMHLPKRCFVICNHRIGWNTDCEIGWVDAASRLDVRRESVATCR